MCRNNIFITGIGTDVGKTVISSIFTQALGAHYWKPVQCGSLDHPDSSTVMLLAGIETERLVPSAYSLKRPMSPHAAAAKEGVRIELDNILTAASDQMTIIEGAGGVLVPINDEHFIIDIASRLRCRVVIVVSYYLGCINHALLTIAEIKQRNIRIMGLVFNGTKNEDTRDILLKMSGLPCLLEVSHESVLDRSTIGNYASTLRERLNELPAEGQ